MAQKLKTRPTLSGWVFLLLLMIMPTTVSGEIADSPQTIRPILTGSQVPDVNLIGLDGTVVHLPSSVARKRTILIFFRGGW